MHGHVDATLLLADENPDIEAQDRDGRTPLHLAAEKGHVDVIQRLLSNRANRAAKDNYGKYALNLAAGNGHTEAVMILTDTGKFEVVRIPPCPCSHSIGVP
jgi:ankyrin repeat protein